MLQNSIPFTELSSIPQSIKDLLNKKLTSFNENIFSWDNFESKIGEKSNSFTLEQRTVLHDVLTSQLSNFSLTESQQTNLESLKDKTTFTITTGHQLNLFTGSTFFIYKILQTIKTTVELKMKFPNHHFVPVFWLATEDHDFEEICFFKTEEKKYSLKAKSGGAVGRITLDDLSFIDEFEEDFKDFPFGAELVSLIKSAYQKGKTLIQATQELVQYLFADRGLLFIDGDDASLKKQMIPLFKEELLEEKLVDLTKPKRDFLQKEYGKVQVNPREINLFYLSDSRNRIIKEGSVWKVLDKNIQWSEKELMNELERYPEKFSPNAIMRPVYQELVLPNLAYIGGNGEINYWLELQDYFNDKNLPFPILIPRVSILFLPTKTLKKIKKLSLNLSDFFSDLNNVLNHNFIENNHLSKFLIEKEKHLIDQFKEIKEEASGIDVTFNNLVDAEEARQLKSFKRMKKRLLRAERIKNEDYIKRVERLNLKIHPNNIWQERVFNFSYFYSLIGRSWLDSCYETIDVTKSELKILEY